MSIFRAVIFGLSQKRICYDQHVLMKNSVILCSASIWTSRPKFRYSRYLLTSYFCIPISCNEKDLFSVLILEGVVYLHKTHQIQLFSISIWGIVLDYCDAEWFAMEMNPNHSVVFEIAPKYYILGSFIDYKGYSISSKGFFPTVVGIMVIWIKFSHLHPF